MMSELLDGTVVVSPSPGFGHADAVLTLAGALRAAAPPGLRVLAAPFPVRLGRQTELRPDLLVARYADLVRDELTTAPLLAVEVRSPDSDLVDRSLKRSVYARHGVAGYWLVDPETPALTALELDGDGDYRTVADVVGAEVFAASRPFPVRVSPLALVAGLRPC
ncbi:MAG TPA: Uma2 family endonuclease [Mycobacteriales bacterium]